MTRLDNLIGKSAAWHKCRRESIGSSDAKVIMAGNADDLLKLWKIKRGEMQDDDLVHVIPVMIGTVTEQLNLALFERETGLTVTRDGEQITSLEFPFMGMTLDGWVADQKAIVECKHIGGFEAWETVVARYIPQITHQMVVMDAARSYLSVIVGTSEYRCQEIERDPFYAAELIEREAAFWNHVVDGTPPVASPPVSPPMPVEKMRTVDLTTSNAWTEWEDIWLNTRGPAKTFEKADKELKLLIEPDVRRAFGKQIEANRDKRGYLKLSERKK